MLSTQGWLRLTDNGSSWVMLLGLLLELVIKLCIEDPSLTKCKPASFWNVSVSTCSYVMLLCCTSRVKTLDGSYVLGRGGGRGGGRGRGGKHFRKPFLKLWDGALRFLVSAMPV